MTEPKLPPVPKTHFRCFHCRNVHARRDGAWHDWQNMQVHLCPKCERATQGRPERATRAN